jgi:hypothetical protein
VKIFNYKKAMTLVELVIAVTIWAVILATIFVFLIDFQKNIKSSIDITWIWEDGFAFRDKLNKAVNGWYSVWTVVVDYPEWVWYDVLMLTNLDETSWFVAGVVDMNTMKLDAPSDYNIYKRKVWWYRQLSQYEINQIKSNPNYVYNLNFYKDKLFYKLFPKDYQVELYNSGTIFDINFALWTNYIESLDWLEIDKLVKQGDLFRFNLNF